MNTKIIVVMVAVALIIIAGVGYLTVNDSRINNEESNSSDFSKSSEVSFSTSSDSKVDAKEDTSLKDDLPNESQSEPVLTQQNFKTYGPDGLYKEEAQIVESQKIYPYQDLPMTLNFEGATITIREIEVEKKVSLEKGGFTAYLTLDDSSRVGFRYSDSDPLSDTDECLGDSNCAGVLTKEIGRSEEEPEDSKADTKLIIGYIGVVNIEYDFENDLWKSIEVGRLTYEEHQYPPTTHPE